jgi:hypothetical protein
LNEFYFLARQCAFQHKVVREQTTKCRYSNVQGNVFICDDPIISYGSVDGGIPLERSANDYDKWCEEMGFYRQSGSIQTQTETISLPHGWVFGCTSHDSTSWHWCDVRNGYWYNERLDKQGSKDRITQVKCQLKNNNPPACVQGNKLYFILPTAGKIPGEYKLLIVYLIKCFRCNGRRALRVTAWPLL